MDEQAVSDVDGPTRGAADVPGFAAAMAELEEILVRLEDDRLDVDHLAADVRRAGELIRVCRERITATKAEIAEIVADIESAGE